MSAEAQEPGTALEQRVAALEAGLERLQHPLMIAKAPPMSEEDAARFEKEFKDALATLGDSGFRHALPKIISSPPTVLDPETVRQLLRECVTVVKPGEVLFFTCPEHFTPSHVRDIQELLNWWLEHNAPDVRVMVLPHGEMAVAEAAEPA